MGRSQREQVRHPSAKVPSERDNPPPPQSHLEIPLMPNSDSNMPEHHEEELEELSARSGNHFENMSKMEQDKQKEVIKLNSEASRREHYWEASSRYSVIKGDK